MDGFGRDAVYVRKHQPHQSILRKLAGALLTRRQGGSVRSTSHARRAAFPGTTIARPFRLTRLGLGTRCPGQVTPCVANKKEFV